jgi:hypothetical protein
VNWKQTSKILTLSYLKIVPQQSLCSCKTFQILKETCFTVGSIQCSATNLKKDSSSMLSLHDQKLLQLSVSLSFQKSLCPRIGVLCKSYLFFVSSHCFLINPKCDAICFIFCIILFQLNEESRNIITNNWNLQNFNGADNINMRVAVCIIDI